jgi:hypothetical protein
MAIDGEESGYFAADEEDILVSHDGISHAVEESRFNFVQLPTDSSR